MKLKISYKLFISNLCIILVLVVALLTMSFFSSRTMITDFVTGLENNTFQNLAQSLEKYYIREGSWQELIDNPPLWRQLVREQLERDGPFAGRQNPFSSDLLPKKQPQDNAHKPKETDSPPPPKDFPPPNLDNFLARLTLQDSNRKDLIPTQIAGKNVGLQAINVYGETVGWLSVTAYRVEGDPINQHFFHRQLRMTYWVAATGMLIAIFVTFFFSRHITSPIKKLTSGAAQIAKRDFRTRIQVHTNDELEELANSVNHISQELLNYGIRQKQWLMDLSHELRTPLTILFGEMEAMREGLTPCNMNTVVSLQEEVTQIRRLVDDLHELSILDTTTFKLDLSNIELVEFIQFHLGRYQDKFHARTIKLILNAPPKCIFVMGDLNRLAQVLQNVLENTLRYVDTPGELRVSLKIEHSHAVIRFCDSGPGVPETAINHLFDRLYRCESSRNRKTGGAGLGLAICQNIVIAHEGEISAHNTVGGGLCITISLPLT